MSIARSWLRTGAAGRWIDFVAPTRLGDHVKLALGRCGQRFDVRLLDILLELRTDVLLVDLERPEATAGRDVIGAQDARGVLRINDTQDVGCLTAPCGDFAGLADSGDGGVGDSFLRWDPAVAPAAPAGYLGDAVTAHRVVGSPLGRNHVSVVLLTDPFRVVQQAASVTFDYLPLYVMLGFYYWVICTVLSVGQNRLETRLNRYVTP